MANTEPNRLVAFFDGTGTDHQGRSLEEILRWSDQRLEICHDYIQTLFPLPERSRFSTASTLIDEGVFNAFRSNGELRDNLRRAFYRMLSFYGLEPQRFLGKLSIRHADFFPSKAENWVVRVNHNHLRITRIIRSLRILGLEEEAEAFFQIVESTYMLSNDMYRPSKESMKFWTRAAKRPLNIAPDVNHIDEVTMGKEFLIKFEKAKIAAEGGGEMSGLRGATDGAADDATDEATDGATDDTTDDTTSDDSEDGGVKLFD